MVPAFILALLAGLLGWARATRRGGNRADRWQYAFAHGIPMFLVGMIPICDRLGKQIWFQLFAELCLAFSILTEKSVM